MRGHYPAINRRFPELTALEQFPVSEANEIRSTAYQLFYEKLSTREKAFVDMLVEILRSEMKGSAIGKQGALELIIAIAQVMEWLDWPPKEQSENI